MTANRRSREKEAQNTEQRSRFLCAMMAKLQSTVVPRPLSNDPRFTQCIYRYSRASKRFVEVYTKKYNTKQKPNTNPIDAE